MNQVCYKIADIKIRVKFGFDYYAEKGYMKDFIIPDVENPDYTIEFCQIDDINVFLEKAKYDKAQLYYLHYKQDEQGKEYCFFERNGFYHAVNIPGEKEGKIYYVSRQWLADMLNEGYQLENFFCLERIFMQFDCMILHSCHIQKDGQAILFSAPSGTGKSTQGELWREYAGAEVINGDRTGIRKINGRWMAFGLPMCGTSGISKNKQAPIRSVVILRQYSNNIVSDMQGREAFLSLYSEITINKWNDWFINAAFDLVSSFIKEVPMYQYLCTKEPEAVKILNDYMLQRESRAKEINNN